jgi:hypothetical protein
MLPDLSKRKTKVRPKLPDVDTEEDEDGGERRRAKAPSFSSPEGGSSRHAPIIFGEEVLYDN